MFTKGTQPNQGQKCSTASRGAVQWFGVKPLSEAWSEGSHEAISKMTVFESLHMYI